MISEWEAVVEFESDDVVVHTAQTLQSVNVWDAKSVEIKCHLSPHCSILHIVQERESHQNQL